MIDGSGWQTTIQRISLGIRKKKTAKNLAYVGHHLVLAKKPEGLGYAISLLTYQFVALIVLR